jgi:hypothetical protein
MRKSLGINKVKFANVFVKSLLRNEPRLTYKHFNNRRYYFAYHSENGIAVELILRVHLKKKYVAAIVHSKSKLKEVDFDPNSSYYHDGFLNRKSFGEFSFEPSKKESFRGLFIRIRKGLKESVADHTYEILQARKGIKLGVNYELKNLKGIIAFPVFYTNPMHFGRASGQLKEFYDYLYEELDMGNGKILDYRIPYVLFSIIQVVFDQKQIVTSNRIH